MATSAYQQYQRTENWFVLQDRGYVHIQSYIQSDAGFGEGKIYSSTVNISDMNKPDRISHVSS